VNPVHLSTGDHQANADDRWRDGTVVSKLTEDQIAEIRHAYLLPGTTQQMLAVRYNVTQAQISNIVTKKQWSKI
jgi:hypothetical protein